MTEHVSTSVVIAETIKSLPDLAKEFYGDLAKPGLSKAGKALETVIDTGNTILLPIKLLNETSRLRFDNYMKKYKERIESIPDDKICTVPPEIGVPILDSLTYTTNEEIAELFLNLLATASSSQMVSNAHPKFIEIIKSLSFDEAKIIQYFNKKLGRFIPFVTCVGIENDVQTVLYKRGTGIEKLIDLEYEKNILIYMNNLVSLGILEISPENRQADSPEPPYKELVSIYSKKIPEATKEKYNVGYKKGYYEISRFGVFFIKACCIKENESCI